MSIALAPLPSFTARPYQSRLIGSVVGAFQSGRKEVLLAACPNAGKTLMSMEIISQMLSQGVQRTLVLAHGTKVLREQYSDELRKHRPDLAPLIDVRIPQELHRHDIQRYDLVIVDEAHQFYGKGENGDGKDQKMMRTILKAAKPKNVLLLTGSPARFIAQGFTADKDMFCFSLEQLHAQERNAVADVMIECASSHYNIKKDGYNQNGELRKDTTFLEKDTKSTLDDVLKTLKIRLELSGEKLDSKLGRLRFKSVVNGWNVALGRMQKTILAVPSIEVAKQAGAYFTKAKVRCLVSHSEDDVESENIATFKDDKETLLLIVVNRAQLGFDHRELFNFIDMTGSKAPDRIYQMLCRVVRSSIENPKRNKLFIKVMPRIFSEIQVRAFMSGVLALSRQENFEAWNGKGLSLLEVPVGREREPRCPHRKKHVIGEACETCGYVKCSELHVIGVQCSICGKTKAQLVPVLEPGMLTFGDYFKALEHDPDDAFCPYAMAKLGDVLGVRVYDPEGRKSACLKWIVDKHKSPSQTTDDPSESSHAETIQTYTRPKRRTFDPIFTQKMKELGWMPIIDRTERLRSETISWIKSHGGVAPARRTPRDPYENQLAVFFRNHKDEPEFLSRLIEAGYEDLSQRRQTKRRDALDWMRKNQRSPSQKAGGMETKVARTIANEKSNTSFMEKVRDLGYLDQNARRLKTQQACMKFFEMNHRWPKQRSEGEEGQLAGMFREYTRPASRCFDLNFHDQCAKLDPTRFAA